jgi:hypothetical protein
VIVGVNLDGAAVAITYADALPKADEVVHH